GDGGLDLVGGFLGGLGASLREVAHLVGDDGEAHAGLAGASGLDGGVEGEDVGLKRDLIYRLDDFADVIAGGFDVLHGQAHLLHVTGPRVGGDPRGVGQAFGRLRVVGVPLCHAGDFLKGGAGF